MSAAHPFVLERPKSIAEALGHLAEHGDEARVMAGGQSLTPLLTLGLSSPGVVVSLDRCGGLARLGVENHRSGSRLSIGAMVSTSDVAADQSLHPSFSLISAAASQVGSPHVRNFGTAVGNVCHGDPGSDLIPALMCLETSVDVRSASTDRSVALDEFIVGPFTNSLDTGEMAVAIQVDSDGRPGWLSAYRKLVKRSGDLAIATCAVRLRVVSGSVAEARATLGGALARAQRLSAVERALADVPASDAPTVALGANLVDDVRSRLLSDVGTPLPYLEQMLPRFVAATVADAIANVSGLTP